VFYSNKPACTKIVLQIFVHAGLLLKILIFFIPFIWTLSDWDMKQRVLFHTLCFFWLKKIIYNRLFFFSQSAKLKEKMVNFINGLTNNESVLRGA